LIHAAVLEKSQIIVISKIQLSKIFFLFNSHCRHQYAQITANMNKEHFAVPNQAKQKSHLLYGSYVEAWPMGF
jgi:hypothetical protein